MLESLPREFPGLAGIGLVDERAGYRVDDIDRSPLGIVSA